MTDTNADAILQNGHEVSAKEEFTDTSSAMSKTTTISTIAVQSGKTRLVIALLHCGDWLQLKILEVSPELTTLGNSLSEAIELQQAHDEVLRQLQNKQSPVEELLRQADQLISTQKPRAEVYAAMAESLGRAWKDINLHLELRKQILDLHVEYHTKADEFFSIQNSLDVSCSDSVVPIDIDAIKQFLTDIHDLRRSLLETLMSSLQIGNSILAKLRELGAEGTLDSRPERIRSSVNRAISQVQGWLDQLHTKRQILEITFTRRKSQLEQCLALAILASDLREVEDTLKEKREILKNTDELGDSSSSAELLQFEHKKLLPEAKQLQERAIKITKATEQLVESGCFAGDKATEQAYNVLSASSDYITELDQRNSLLDCVIAFFRKAQTAFTKLDQLEIQIKTSELPSTSPKLAQLHEQCARAVQEITSPPIEEGYSILGSTEHRSHGTDGVKRMVEELENRKIAIDALCTAHREEKLRINQALNSFLEQQNELYSWLISAAEAFLQGHQDMGSDLPMARDFWDLHNRLLVDLQTKGNEINALLLTLPPVLEYLEDDQRHDVDQKVEELHQLWLKLKNILETRLDLAAIYVKFHMEADYVNKEIDQLEELLKESPKDIDEETLNKIEEQWESLIPLYQSAKNTGITFINATNTVSEQYLDTKRACVCVETVLEKLSGRQLVVTRNWQSFHTSVVEKREIQMQLQLNMTESTKTINWITKLESQLYPVITTNATNPEDVSAFLEQKLETAFPEIKRAQAEVEQRIKTVDALINKTTSIDEQTLNVKNKLVELNEKLGEITTEYQILLQMLITYFNNLTDMDNTVSDLNSQLINKSLPNRVAEIDAILSEQEASRRAVMEMFKFAQNDADKLCTRIDKQEPKDAAEHDINKLQHQIVVRKSDWDERYTKTNNTLEIHRQYCQFNFDLSQINEALTDLAQQLGEMKGQYGESLPAAKATSQAFSYFEKTTEILNQRIKTFINESKSLIDDGHVHSGHIGLQITELQDRWDDLKKQIEETRQSTDLSIRYFSIVEEAIDWFKQGSHILVSIARKTTAVKKPEEAQALLNEIEEFLKPGEVKQAERIAILTSLARELYQPQIRNKSTQVANDNQEMLESFSSIGKELHSLIDNLRLAEEERERLKREQEAADALLAAAKAEAEIARATAVAAENARREAEAAAKRIAEAEAKRRAEEEARRLAEEESRKRAEEEARRLAEIETRKRAEEEARRRAEEEARKRAEEEAIRRAEEEARRRAEEEFRKRAEEEARRLAEIEVRRLAEVEARRRAEEEAIQRAEEEARRLAEIEAIKRAQQEAIKRAEEEARRRAEQESRKRAEEEAIRRAEEEARKRAEEEDKRLAMEEAKRVKQIMEVDKVSKIITTNVEIPVKSAEVSNNEIINKEIITRTVEVVTVKHLDQIAPKEVNQASISITAEPPVFVLPLTDTELQEGSKFTFICQVRGSPTPSVVWYKDGIAIENNPDYKTSFNKETCTLTIEETFADDSAKYTCKATNPSGSAETSAVLSVKEVLPEEELIPPTFVQYLEPAAVKQGQKFQFECKVKGNPLPTVQWFKNNECIDNYPDYSITYNNGGAILKFEEVSLNDKANYTCKASNRVGTAQSTANLCVQPQEKTENPCFIIPLSNVMARAGQKIKLECEVSGLPTPSLTWSHDGKPVKETRELKLYSDDKRNILAISEAFPKNAGTYIVTAKNIVGETTSECTVTVKGRLPTETSDSEIASDMEPIKPSIQVPLKDISVFDGKTVRLDCVIVGQPEPEVIWYHDEKPVKESADFQLLFQGDRCSLVIQEAFAEDAGEYKVVALNSAGEASSKCVLTVTPLNTTEPAVKEQEETKPTGCPPKFNKLLSDVLASEGDKVTLEAVIEGVPYPEVKWLLNNQDIESGEHLKISHNNDGVVKLEIEKVLPEDKGVYTVKATNVHGDAKCFSQLIVKSFKPVEIQKEYEEVKSPPTFRETFTDRQAFVDTAIKFESIVAGKPTPKVKWLFNDEPVSGKDFLISTSGDRQVLSIPNVSLSNAGKITCIAENDIGKAICTATLSVVPPSESIVEPQLITDMQQLSDTSSFSTKKEVYLQSSTTSTSTVITNTAGGEPDVQSHAYISKDSQSFKQVNQEPPEVHESHVVEEFHKLGKEPGLVQERFSTTIKVGEENKAKATVVNNLEHPARVIKQRPPKFTNPIMGKIVDQGVDVVLEGIIDSYPAPSIKWEKNGIAISNNDKVTTSFEFNKVRIEIKNVTSNDAGRYTCTAVNDAGSAISTSDLVVRKTIFPPVFGRRLQAQVVKKGDRVHMDVEVTGTPTPTVTWFKDEKPIKEVIPEGYKIRVQGNSHTLVIEKVDFLHTGKYMARAVNDGGEAQSIADFVVFEPTPDTMVEVVKTVVFEDVHKHETLAQAAEQSKTTYMAPQVKSFPISVSKPQPVSLISFKSTPKSHIELSENVSESLSSEQAEYSTVKETTISKESKTIKIESNTADFSHAGFKSPVQKEVFVPTVIEKPIEITQQETIDAGIESASITKQSSLDYFVQKLKESEEPVKPKEVPKGTPLQPGIYTKFEDASQTDTRIIPTHFATETLNESMSSKLSFINEPFNLIPEPPAEICFTPRKETYLSQNEEVIKTETAHKHFKTSLEAPAPQFRPTSPKPSAEALEMEKLWTPHREPERPILSSPLPTRPISSLSEPSPKGLAMEKAWAHKSEIHRDHAWPPTQPVEETKSWSTQTTLEKKWIPTQTKSFASFQETTVSNEPIHYVAKVTDLHEKGYDNISSMTHTKEINENIVYEQSAKPSEIIKSWPPPSHVEDVKPIYKPVTPSIHSLSIRPASVQDITDEVYLEPGPPPEIDYAPPPLPPKQERPQAPPVPARPYKPAEHKKPQTDNRPFQKFRKLEPFLLQGEEKKPVESETKTFQKVPKLEPFPFQVDEMKPKPIKTGPPITPSKFLKGRFADSDYESDYELSRIPPKWKPATSDTEELTFRHVKAPKFSAAARSKSVEPVPLSTKFITPTFTHQPYNTTTYSKSYVGQKREISPPLLRPGTPPEYLEIHSNFKTDLKNKQTVDGYMADTDEPLTLKKKISKFESKQHESTKSEYYSSSETSRQKFSYESQTTPKPVTPKYYRKTTTSAPKKELIATPIITSVSTTKNKVIHRDEREPILYTPDPVKIINKGPPPPSPSKFVKGEFRGSDYESDYEGRISSVWRADSDRTYKRVQPILTPSGRHSEPIGKTPTPPTEFDQPPQFSGPPRPKFEPIEKPLAASKLSESLSHKSTLSQVVHKPKPVTPKVTVVKEIDVQPKYPHSPKVTQYYRSTTSAPYQNAIQTETSNVMHFKESTESCHRSMSLEQTRKVITFGQDKKEERIKEIGALPAKPAKFVKSDFRKSDHESELDHSKIKSVWTPRGDGSLPHYRTVKAPQTPTKFDKIQQERILSPMEFESPSSTFETKTYNSTESKKNVSGIRRQFEENVDNKIVKYNNVNLKPGSPPEYSYSPVTVTKIASKNMENMSHTFKSKAQQFASDIMMDVNKKSDKITDNSPQVYKEETRASQHGTKHVDPDTGLIYFKYDFGYEFGIILPGQSKGGEIVTPKKTIIEPPKRTKDIEMPVYHESSYPKYNSGSNFRPVKIMAPSKTVKWEPTSESEMSEYEDGKKKYLSSPRWEQSSTSPMSISPSLPSTSPAFNTAGFRSADTRFSAPSTPVNYIQNTAQPKKPPIFITPLRDIAVVSGQAARFECIVQSEPPPSILWSKNGRIIENSNDLQIYYRNGVCRLTIPQAFPEDAGSYTCTATNQIGAVGTTATLQVPGERRSQYIK